MTELPVTPEPNQEFMIILDGQSCTVNIYQLYGRVYLDLFKDSYPVQTGVRLQPMAPSITRACSGFKGNIRVIDTLSTPDTQSDPYYEGLGTRFRVFYLSDDEEQEIAQHKLHKTQAADKTYSGQRLIQRGR